MKTVLDGIVAVCRRCSNKLSFFLKLRRTEVTRDGRKLQLYKCFGCQMEIGVEVKDGKEKD